jgi:predicted secreted hydrolase
MPPAAPADPVRRGRPLVFPRDHGAHLGQRTEWWYATGWLQSQPAGSDAPAATAPVTGTAGLFGFQITFFRSRTGLATALPGRFAPRQLLFAHAAVTDLDGQRHGHDQRIVRWSEDPTAATGAAALDDGRVHIGDWSFQRAGPLAPSRWQARLPARDFGITLDLDLTQPPVLQGDAGFSRKGPQEEQASHYYSLPQMTAAGQLRLGGRDLPLMRGRAWLDHEWSDDILHPEAVGWDWIGMNLFDGSALTAFVLRRQDGSALWAGGSFRGPAAVSRSFGAQEVLWQPGRVWRSPASGAAYPVQWTLQTPAGRYGVRALADAQELDSRGSTGSIYWEGLSELLDASGHRVGLGYLEMTGYAGPLRMG